MVRWHGLQGSLVASGTSRYLRILAVRTSTRIPARASISTSVSMLFFGLIVTVSGCSDPTGTGLHSALQTDRASYVAQSLGGSGSAQRFGFTVTARFVNSSNDTLFLAWCYPDSPYPIYGVELVNRATTDMWGAAYGSAWACVGHDNPAFWRACFGLVSRFSLVEKKRVASFHTTQENRMSSVLR